MGNYTSIEEIVEESPQEVSTEEVTPEEVSEKIRLPDLKYKKVFKDYDSVMKDAKESFGSQEAFSKINLPDEPMDQPDSEIEEKIKEYLYSSTDEEKRQKARELLDTIVEKYNINLVDEQQRKQVTESNRILQETDFDTLVENIRNDKYKNPLMEKYPKLYKTFKYLALSKPGKWLGKKALAKAKKLAQDHADIYGVRKVSSPKRKKQNVTLSEIKEMAKKYKVSPRGSKRQIAARILSEKGHYKTVISQKDRKKINSIFEA
tara:strand:- start:4664 stop:5449 length:786 start_codon:yes stop_codon:yes gene_type:complete